MAKYVYPAIFTPEEDGGFSIEFPDVKGCCTQGKDMADGIEMATDALCLMLYNMEERGKEIPKASDIRAVSAAADSIVTLIACDTLDYKHYFENKTVNKTLAIPAWLNTMAESKGLNFSQILQKGLKEELHVQ